MQYLTTHPWIKFEIDLERAPARLWGNLGEAAAKCEHIAGVPLQPKTAEAMHELYLAKGAQATTAIEGNSLTENEVLQHVRGELKLPPSKEYLQQEVDNIVKACNDISSRVMKGEIPRLTPDYIGALNAMVLKNLDSDAEVAPGKIRTMSVVVGNVHRGAPAQECAFLLQKLCDWMETLRPQNDSEVLIYAMIKAVIFHAYIAWIHPFVDGNGRTARLVEFQILLTAGIPTPAGHLLSNHYNQTRRRYYTELDRASKSGGDLMPFIEYAVQGFVDGLRQQWQHVREQLIRVTWIDYVHEAYRDDDSAAGQRQKQIALALLAHSNEGLSPLKIKELTPKIAALYARKSTRTLYRDIDILAERKLITVENGVKAGIETILAFCAKEAVSAAFQPAPVTGHGTPW